MIAYWLVAMFYEFISLCRPNRQMWKMKVEHLMILHNMKWYIKHLTLSFLFGHSLRSKLRSRQIIIPV